MTTLTGDEIRTLIDDPARRAEVPARELTEAFLDRIATVGPAVNCYLTVTPELALAGADEVDRRRAAGTPLPLDGLPVAFKDNIDVGGVRTTVGSTVYVRDAERDAALVERLRAAGAIVLGKLHLHEFVFGVTSDNPHYGPCRNPWDLERIPGGSSGGSGVAVATDLCVGSIGSDTGGSVRIPAHLNGVTGMRPTYGAVSARGTFPISRSFDTFGPMARSAGDMLAMLRAMAGFDPDDPRSKPGALAEPPAGIAGLRIGIPEGAWFFGGLDPDVERLVREAADVLAGLGARLETVAIEDDEAEAANAACATLTWTEAYALHRRVYHETPERLGADTVRRLRLGEVITGAEFADAVQTVLEWRRTMARLFERVDLLLTPSGRTTAPRRADSETVATTAGFTQLTQPISLAALPAVSVPCGLSDDGLPVGVQLVAAPWADAVALRAAIDYQSATDHHLRRAPAALTGAG
jgi:aspartyl-tRNA(Asn)/glutamyl-tRNA(Gln) amidotransferase subunit A